MTSSILPPLANGFTISLADPQGQMVGGSVVGSLLAAGTVYIIAASFNNLSYHRLPAKDDMRNSASGENDQSNSPLMISGGGDSGHPLARAESCGMPIFIAVTCLLMSYGHPLLDNHNHPTDEFASH